MDNTLSTSNLISTTVNWSSLICKICSNIAWAPVLCKSCKALYCSCCITLYVHSHKTCPCGQKFRSLTCPPSLEKDFDSLVFSCGVQGCEQLVSYRDLKQHKKQCVYSKNTTRITYSDYTQGQESTVSCENSIIKTYNSLPIPQKTQRTKSKPIAVPKKTLTELLHLLNKCTNCKEIIVSTCAKQCNNCGNYLCNRCARLCLKCRNYHCGECMMSSINCNSCKESGCTNCLIQCISCETLVCILCVKRCKGCNQQYCVKCGVKCLYCTWTLMGKGNEVVVSNTQAYITNKFSDNPFIIRGNKEFNKGIHKFEVIPIELQRDCSSFGFGVANVKELEEWSKPREGFKDPAKILIGITADNIEMKKKMKGLRAPIEEGAKYIISLDLNKLVLKIKGPGSDLRAELNEGTYVPLFTRCHGRFNIFVNQINTFYLYPILRT